jgi:DNA helicase-2/ATP-dependent DNA helicase PcrA
VKKFTPTKEQEIIIDHFNGHALVVAGPGSGKTVTLVAHVRKLILERSISPDDIWVMAFNRDISSKLKEQIENEVKGQAPQVTTIHTFILNQTLKHEAQLFGDFEIAESLGEYGKRNLLWSPIRKRLNEKHGITKTIQGKHLNIKHVKGYLWNLLRDYWLTCKKPNDEVFDKFNFEIKRLKTVYKIVFLDELALRFFETMKANPSFRHEVATPRIVIDEFQDLNPTEHGILQQFHTEGTIFMAFGDDDQAVNDFRRAHADFIRDFTKVYKPVQYPLARDRRCPKEILELADEFVKGFPRLEKSPGYATHQGRVEVINFPSEEDEKLGVKDIVKKYLSLFPQYKENPQVLILSGAIGRITSESRISEFIEMLREAQIDNITGDKKEDPLDNEWGLAFKALSTMLIKDLSPMNLASWLTVTNLSLMQRVNEYLEAEDGKGNQIDFLRAVLNLKANEKEIQVLLSDIESLKDKIKDENFNPEIVVKFIPTNLNGRHEAETVVNKTWNEFQKKTIVTNQDSETIQKDEYMGRKFLQFLLKQAFEDIMHPEISRVHVTTYRKAKGLEADLVIVTAVDSTEFFENGQKRRLLYVAATRSKKNLILTFADKRSGARRYTHGRSNKYKGVPKVFRSPLIPNGYKTKQYSEAWLNDWVPV